MALLLGYDVGSSSIKATLLDGRTGQVLAGASSPDRELEIIAPKIGWAEQHPQTWWQHVVTATQKIKAQVSFSPADVKAIGISYQMHGLVIVDKNKQVLRPSIIWCDSRAVAIGEKAAKDIGRKSVSADCSTSPAHPASSMGSAIKRISTSSPVATSLCT